MSGIVFFGTNALGKVRDFYVDRVGMTIWLEQPDCVVLKHGNMLLGFCARDRVEMAGTITFFYGSPEEVDAMHGMMGDRALTPPKDNQKYMIHHFFAADPEDRPIEFQSFLRPVGPHLDGLELLTTRRSVRKFLEVPPKESEVLALLDSCRSAPTSRNSQPAYYVLVEEAHLLDQLGQVRGQSSAPIARAPLAVAVCSDPAASERHTQDGDIAAYHLLLAAWARGLGTCWIADMDRDEVKDLLGVPRDHYVATVTPLGYPESVPAPTSRKELAEYVRFPGK
ncbi:MAG: nitroreductase family protein [Thermoplasmata archaeon]|nr:nitroreductase family protein [Thermoplasmata archaeon]